MSTLELLLQIKTDNEAALKRIEASVTGVGTAAEQAGVRQEAATRKVVGALVEHLQSLGTLTSAEARHTLQQLAQLDAVTAANITAAAAATTKSETVVKGADNEEAKLRRLANMQMAAATEDANRTKQKLKDIAALSEAQDRLDAQYRRAAAARAAAEKENFRFDNPNGTVSDVSAISGVVRVAEGQQAIRAVERFVATTLGAGGLFQLLFPPMAFVASMEFLAHIKDNLVELVDGWNPIIQAEKKANEALQEYSASVDHVRTQLHDLDHAALERALGKTGTSAIEAARLESFATTRRQQAEMFTPDLLAARKERDAANAAAPNPSSDVDYATQVNIIEGRKRKAQADVDVLEARVSKLQNDATVFHAQAVAQATKSLDSQQEENEKRDKPGIRAEKVIDAETVSLRAELANMRARELTGLDAINAKHDGTLEKLKAQKKLNAENIDLLNQITAAETSRYNQQVAIAALQSKRGVDKATYDVTRRLSRAMTEGAADIEVARGKHNGDDEGAIQGAYSQRLAGAREAFVDASRNIQQMRLESAEREALQHDAIALDKEEKDIQTAQIKASGEAALALYLAQRDRELALIALQSKRFADAASAANNLRMVTDAATKADIADRKAGLRLQSELLAANSQPGGEIPLLMQQQALRRQSAQMDRDERAKDIAAQRQALAELLAANPDRDKEVSASRARLRVQEIENERNLERELGDQRIELEVRIAQLRTKALEEYKQAFVGLVNASFSGGDAVGKYLEGLGKKLLDKVVGNIAGLTFDAAKKAMPKVGGQVDSKGNLTTLGKVLQGTPLGVDQAKLAAEKQTLATKTLTDSNVALRASVDALTAAMQTQGVTSDMQAAGDTAISGVDAATSDSGAAPAAGAGGKSGRSLSSTLASVTAIAGGAIAAYQGFHKGGAKGALEGVAGLASTTAGIAMMFGPAGAPVAIGASIVAAGAGLLSSLFGESKAKYEKQLDKVLAQGQYIAPTSTNTTTDTRGFMADYDAQGKLRTSPFDGTTINNGYLDREHGTDNWRNIPGYATPDLSHWGDNAVDPARMQQPQTGGALTIHLTVQALDSKSILDRSGDIGLAISKELSNGSPLGLHIQQKVLGS